MYYSLALDLNLLISLPQFQGKKSHCPFHFSPPALIRCHLQQYLIRKHEVIREGVVRPGKHNLLNTVYVPPEISTCVCGGVDPPSRSHAPSADTFVGLHNLFRLQRGGRPVRTVVTTGIPGIGLSVSVGKYSLDWAQMLANRVRTGLFRQHLPLDEIVLFPFLVQLPQDLQFIIKLSFRKLWSLRSKFLPPSQTMSIMEVTENYYPECKDMTFLEEDDCKFLVIMDSYDCYRAPLDWEVLPTAFTHLFTFRTPEFKHF